MATTVVSDVWGFKRGDDQRWRWTRESLTHQVLDTCRAPFGSLDECVADARRYGYSGPFSISDEPTRDAPGRSRRGRR